MENEKEEQQNNVADLLITENALKRYTKFLDRQLLAIPHLSETHEVKELIKDRITTTKERTQKLISKTVKQINDL